MGNLLTFSSQNRVVGAVIALFLTVVSLAGISKLTIDTSYDSFLNPNDPGYPSYHETIETFGSDSTTVIYIKDPDLFSLQKLQLIEEAHYLLEELDGVERVDSLFTALNIRDKDGFIITQPLIEYLPETTDEIEKIKSDALYSPLINGNLISDDGTVTAINVTTGTASNDKTFNRRIFDKIDSVISLLHNSFEEVFQVGPPRLNIDIEDSMVEDMTFLTPLSILILVSTITIFLKTVHAASTPLITAGISIVWSFGFMGYIGIPLNLLTAILPSLVIVIGSTEDTHMLASYFRSINRQLKGHSNISNDQIRQVKIAANKYMARHMSLPIVLTSLTTVVGFASNSISNITLIQDFAIATSFAMFSNLVSTVLLLPLVLSLFTTVSKKPKPRQNHRDGNRFISSVADKIISIVTTRPNTIILITLLFVASFLSQVFSISISNDPLSYFKPSHKIIKDSDKLHNDLSGMQLFYISMSTNSGRTFREHELMSKLNTIENRLINRGAFDKIVTVSSHLALVNQEMNNADSLYFKTPDDNNLIEQYMLFFQRSDLDRYINNRGDKVNIIVRHNISDSSVLNAHLAEIKNEINMISDGDFQHLFTGKNLMINQSAEELLSGQIFSLLILAATVFIVISLLYTSIVAGLISLIPNLIPVVLMFGIMGLFGITLNPGTATVAVIAIGIAVDDTIHMLTRYNNQITTSTNQSEAIQNTIRIESVPVISTSLALAAGFGILVISNFNIVAQFGILSALTIFFAMIADLIVTPALMQKVRLVGIWDIIALKVGGEVLSTTPLFRGLNNFQIRKAILLSNLESFNSGDIIVNQDEIGNDMYIILRGNVEIICKNKDFLYSDKLLAKLYPGDFFGEIGFIRAHKRTATAMAIGEVLVLKMNNSIVEKNMRFYPRISSRLILNISHVLAQRLGETIKKHS